MTYLAKVPLRKPFVNP